MDVTLLRVELTNESSATILSLELPIRSVKGINFWMKKEKYGIFDATSFNVVQWKQGIKNVCTWCNI